jgi:N-acetylmuramoyl-L-alanine amidase
LSPGSSPTLRLGSSGAAVRDLQSRLASLGIDVGDPPARYGEGTEAAVRSFQALRGIRVDGVCGPETWSTLRDSGYRLGDRLLCARQPMLRGDDVGDLQARLNALGFDAGKEDGILGPSTEHALTEFQRNAGITIDGICGPDTIAALVRLGARAGGAVAVARERDALRDPRGLVGRRVFVTATEDLAVVAERLKSGLGESGADAVVQLAAVNDPDLAGAANRYRADLFVAIRPRSADDREPHGAASCRCCFYASGTFRSEAGYAIASAVADEVARVIGGPGAACGRAYAVLRETRMTAVVCEPVVEGDDAALQRLLSAPELTADAVLRAIRKVYERPVSG